MIKTLLWLNQINLSFIYLPYDGVALKILRQYIKLECFLKIVYPFIKFEFKRIDSCVLCELTRALLSNAYIYIYIYKKPAKYSDIKHKMTNSGRNRFEVCLFQSLLWMQKLVWNGLHYFSASLTFFISIVCVCDLRNECEYVCVMPLQEIVCSRQTRRNIQLDLILLRPTPDYSLLLYGNCSVAGNAFA